MYFGMPGPNLQITAEQKLALRSGVLAATRTVDVQFKYQANRHVENVTRADIKRRQRASKQPLTENICRAKR
jgi:hypothetical protein